MPGSVEIEDVADALDVEPARGDVGGDEDVDLTALEQIEFGEPLRLFHVAVDLAGLETRALEALVQLAHGRLAVAEDDRGADLVLAQQIAQPPALVRRDRKSTRLNSSH